MKTYESHEKKLFIFGEYRQSGFPGGLLCCAISVSSSFLLQYSIIMQREKTTAGVLSY